MTVVPPPGRVVASVPAPKVTASAPMPAGFLPVPRQQPTSRLRVGQVVTVQVLMLAIGASLAGPAWSLPLVGACAIVVLAAAFGRHRGRWWYEHAALHHRFGARRRSVRQKPGAPVQSDPRLRVLAPSMTIREVEVRGTRFGTGLDDAGWFAAFVVAPPSGLEAEHRLVEAVDRLSQILRDTDAPVSALQVVHHCVPVATVAGSPGQWLWVALRLDADDALRAAATRGGGVAGVDRALAAAVGRVQKSLRVAGMSYYRVLAPEELRAAVAAVGGFGEPRQATAIPTEHWTAWYGTDAAHVCFRLSGVPSASLSFLVAALSQGAVRSFTISVRLSHQDGADPQVDALLRIGIGAGPVPAVVREVTAVASRLGLRLSRLDGQHGPAVYAAAPTARQLGPV